MKTIKTLLLFGLFLACALNMVYAQEIETKEIEVREHTYKVMTWEDSAEKRIWIEKTTDSLRYLRPGFDWDNDMEIKYNLTDIEQIIKEYIAPVLRQSGLHFDDDKEKLHVSTIFDLDGNLREFAISFPQKLKIPMTVVDDFFTAVLSSGIKCTFKKDHPGLKNARFVYFNSVFILKGLQE